ncbi:MAG: hypothetical protein LUI10_10125 [Lachnospiraceae bacterium]|nr:hypothetical protein [Lachnospiraceae bacterium]
MMEMTPEIRTQLDRIINSCASQKDKERPESIWLNDMYTRFQHSEGIFRKSEADELIYSKMYAALPQNPSDTLKIRYWRTGRHTPSNRDLCTAFGRAMELSEEEMRILLLSYYDRSDLVFETEPSPNDPLHKIYRQRLSKMQALAQEYLWKIHPLRRMQLNVRRQDLERNLRHFYFMDARACLSDENRSASERHIASINYESEFKQQMRLLGEIPRKSMIRHIFLLSQPFLNRQTVSQALTEFGYLPLQEEHTTVKGEQLDLLIIRFLELYEKTCTGLAPEECSKWLQGAYRYLDQALKDSNLKELRFLYFKALE